MPANGEECPTCGEIVGQGEMFALERTQTMAALQKVGGSLDPDVILGRVADGMMSVGGYSGVVGWLFDGSMVAPKYTAEVEEQLGRSVIPNQSMGAALSSGEPYRVRHESILYVPLVHGMHPLGLIELRGEGRGELATLKTIATHGATALTAARLHREIELRSETDGLTRVFNRRKLESDLRIEVARSLRYHHPLSVLMIDIDHFKLINDKFGHQVGDDVLRTVGTTLDHECRETDGAYRYGGEEFTVLLRETDADLATAVAERFRSRIAEAVDVKILPQPVSVSIGVASLNGEVEGATMLIRAADMALYQAKQMGRDRVMVSDLIAGDTPSL